MITMTASRRILVTAATKWEAGPVARALRADERFVVLKTGMGAARTSESLEDLEGFACAVSTGFCGSLQPGMRSGDLVADLRGADAELPPAARELAASLGLTLHFGRIADAAAVCGPAEKAVLAARRAAAVDMETAAVRRWADAARIPALAVRAILDEADDVLPPAPSGEDFPALARYVIGNLGSLPLLVRTGLRQRRAGAALARFLPPFLELL